MKKTTINHFLIYSIAAFFTCITVSSCLPHQDNLEFPTTVQVGLELQGVGIDTSITAGSDEINITQVGVIHGASFFETDGDSLFLLQNPDSPVQVTLSAQTGNVAVLASGSLIGGSYQSLRIKFPKAPQVSSDIDPTFTDGGRFSVVVNGSYNGDTFTFKSDRNLEKVRNFSPNLQVPELNASYLFLVKSDVGDWFLADDGQSLLNPSDSDNYETINDNIEVSFEIDVTSSDQANQQ